MRYATDALPAGVVAHRGLAYVSGGHPRQALDLYLPRATGPLPSISQYTFVESSEAHALRQDETFKHAVFDLLYDGKFRNWRQIRELKLIYDNTEAREALEKARKEPDPELAEDHLENAMTIARSRRAELR